jgi:hypothetical protein
MSNSLLRRDREDITTKALATVISMQSATRESYKQKEETSNMKAEKKTPLFYTKPIFKSKKHDFF